MRTRSPTSTSTRSSGSLDADSRAYLQLLINGAGAGLAGKGGSELAQVLERYEPTHRDLARVNGAIAVRGADLRQLVNSLQRLNTALATKQGQIVQLVDSSAKVFRAFASEDGNISLAIKLLPATLSQTTATLQKVETFAKLLGPTATNLLPAAQALPSANAALVALSKPSTPIVKNQIRPFVIAAQPLVKQLEPAASNLAAATPNLSKTFNVINHLGNMLGYNPGNSRARLPVVAGVARPRGPDAVLDPGRERRLQADLPAAQLRVDEPGRERALRFRAAAEPDADHEQPGTVPDPVDRQRPAAGARQAPGELAQHGDQHARRLVPGRIELDHPVVDQPELQ